MSWERTSRSSTPSCTPSLRAASRVSPAAASAPRRWPAALVTGSSVCSPTHPHRRVRSCGRRGQAALRGGAGLLGRGRERRRRTATEWWPNAVTPGELVAELPLPRHFEQDASRTSEGDIAKAVVCGPDPEAHIARIREYADAATTTSWSTRSARTKRDSSGSTSSRCSRSWGSAGAHDRGRAGARRGRSPLCRTPVLHSVAV